MRRARAAPEALISRRFEATPDEAATVWICGVFLYAMLCDRYPVRARPICRFEFAAVGVTSLRRR